MSCLAETTVLELLAGGLSPAQLADVDDHVDSCASCRQLVRAVAKGSSPGDVGLLATAADLAGAAPPVLAGGLARGASLGRYLILDVLGEGGMGVVYAAFDPELDRKVAVKLLRPALGGGEAGAKRLLREGRAIAKLAHPNVVAVFDVGTHDGAVFVAMELVAGRSLDAWLAAAPRPWQEVVAVFLQAGEGLVAAHAAGMVHRDFKPANVLLGDDGRVRVTDFGLARFGESDGGTARDSVERLAIGSDPGRLTRTGALVGTPAYMAPEQFDAGTVDAKTDQFSFAVSLYEALYGERPFAGLTVGELVANLSTETIRPPTARTVPPWLRAIVLRGMRAPADARYPTLAAMLADLRRDRGRRTRAVLGGAAIAAALAAGGIALASREAGAPACTLAAAPVAQAWNPIRRAQLAAGFAATGVADSDVIVARVAANLDEYAAALGAMYVEACTATQVQGTQSAHLLDLRTECLNRRAGELGAYVDVFAATKNPKTAQSAVSSSAQLPPIAACADTKALTELVPRPQDPATRARLDELQPKLAHLAARAVAGEIKASLADTEALVAASKQVDYPPFQASALNLLAEIKSRLNELAEADRLMEASIDAAARGRDHKQVAAGYVWRVINVGLNLGKHEAALALADVAARANDQAGTNPLLTAKIHAARSTILLALDRPDEAVAEAAKAFAAREQIGDPLGIARAHLSSATALLGAGDQDAAAPHFEAAKVGLESALNPHHPELIGLLHNYGELRMHQGRLAEARALNERAVAIADRAYGPGSTAMAAPMNNLGSIALRESRFADAVAIYRELQRTMTGVLDAKHPFWGVIGGQLGEAYLGLGDLAQARPALEQSIAHLEQAVGKTHDALTQPVLALAQLLERAGERGPADAAFTRAIALAGKRDAKARAAYDAALAARKQP